MTENNPATLIKLPALAALEVANRRLNSRFKYGFQARFQNSSVPFAITVYFWHKARIHRSMKTKITTQSRADKNLFDRIEILLESDLSAPSVEASARAVLNILRRKGYSFLNSDKTDPDCLLCLFEALLSAATLAPARIENHMTLTEH